MMSNAAHHYYWIWVRNSRMSADASLLFKTSRVDNNVVHWTSQETFALNDPEYPVMHSVYRNRTALPPLLEKERLPKDLYNWPPAHGSTGWLRMSRR
jgi:hypothetical protein